MRKNAPRLETQSIYQNSQIFTSKECYQSFSGKTKQQKELFTTCLIQKRVPQKKRTQT